MHSTFLSCDWGTSSFRLRLAGAAPFRILAEVRSADGASSVRESMAKSGAGAEAAFRATFARGLDDLRGDCRRLGIEVDPAAPAVISGMASSTIGWRELPYARVPLGLDGAGIVLSSFEVDGRRVLLVSGLRTDDDVLRGEETEVLGMFADPEHAPPRDEALLILPGTHSKHVRVAGGSIVDFSTYMTGELFHVLATDSILRHSVDLAQLDGPAADGTALEAAFKDGASAARRDGLSSALFRVRTNQVLHAMPPGPNAAFLSGLVIGAEVWDAASRHPRALPLILGAGGSLSRHYLMAFEALGLSSRLAVLPPAAMEAASARGHAFLLQGR